MKKDEFYYINLCACVESAYEAATYLEKVVTRYNPDDIANHISKMHEIEQGADIKKHEMMDVLNRAFITPIEREDLVDLSGVLDDITDAIEDVLLQIYMCNVRRVRVDIAKSIQLLIECIDCLRKVFKEFANFKNSTNINKHIVQVNDFEEKGDHLYQSSVHTLYKEGDLNSIVVWKNIYEGIENCFDKCEHAADIVQTVIMKNT